MQPRHLLGEAQGVFSTHLQRVKHEPAAHVRIVRVVGEVRHTFRVLLWLEITSRTFRRTSQLLRKNTKQKYEGTTPARGDLATKLALLTPQLKRKHDSPWSALRHYAQPSSNVVHPTFPGQHLAATSTVSPHSGPPPSPYDIAPPRLRWPPPGHNQK